MTCNRPDRPHVFERYAVHRRINRVGVCIRNKDIVVAMISLSSDDRPSGSINSDKRGQGSANVAAAVRPGGRNDTCNSSSCYLEAACCFTGLEKELMKLRVSDDFRRRALTSAYRMFEVPNLENNRGRKTLTFPSQIRTSGLESHCDLELPLPTSKMLLCQ